MTRLAIAALCLFILSIPAHAAKPASFSGLWLTDLGLMELEQTGDNVKGRFALGGTSTIEGTLTGTKLEFTYKAFRAGKGSFDLAANSATFAGSAADDGSSDRFDWKGRKAPEYVRHVKLLPGKIVDGSTKNLLTYAVRTPIGYKAT